MSYNIGMSIFDFLSPTKKRRPPKIGLALGSGGFKGGAHLGAITALYEEGFEFSYVAGTSVGALVGAFVAMGFSPKDMLGLVKELGTFDLKNRLSLPLEGFSIEGQIDRMIGGKGFENLKIGFTAVATDLDSGKEVLLSSGELKEAVAASCAICPPFKPVKIGDKRLIDGAFVNAVPADVVKNMGADGVVAVSLGSHRLNDGLKKNLDLVYKNNGIKAMDRLWQIKYADLLIEPDLEGLSAASPKDFLTAYRIGYEAAKEKINDLKSMI